MLKSVKEKIILGIDPGTNYMGYGVLKVEGTKALGAEVVLHGDGFDDAYAYSLELQKQHGYVYIHPFIITYTH